MRARICVTLFAASLAFGCGSGERTSPGPGTDGGADATHESDDTSGGDDVTQLEGGESEAGRPDGAGDAQSGSLDAGGFACGDIVCNHTEVCVHQASGCMIQAHPDGGTCPLDASISDAGLCESSGPAPYCWSPDAGTTLICDEDGGLFGVINGLTTGTDRVCYSSCT
jgi:hypothetical protein